MAKIFLEATDSESTITMNGASVFGLAGDQVVAVAAKGLTVDAAVERLEFTGAMSEYTFKQLGPNALEVTKGDTVTKVFVQDDANGTQLTFENGTVNAQLGATGTMTIGQTLVSQATSGAITPATIDTSIVTPHDGGQTPGTTGLNLKVDQDVLVGSADADTFSAPVVQNLYGGQVNTLGSGDSLDGKGGVDTLSAKITSGFFAGNTDNGTMPIQPETKSVEIVKLQAVNANIDGDSTTVYVNAKDMTGVTFIGSNHSDANLTIQNLTTLTDDGTIRPVSAMTVGMGYTGNADPMWDESDLHVYFDQD